MEHFVYIIFSDKYNIFYKGYSSRPFKRVEEHNNGLSRYTKNKRPWKLVFLQKFDNKKDALIKENQLKRANKKYIFWIINQDCNLLK